jgi:hypothetical protein
MAMVMTAWRSLPAVKGAAGLVQRAYLHSSVTGMSAYWHCINFLRDRRKTRDKPEKFDQDKGSTLHVERR